MRLPTGARLGPYEILGLLGAGGMGEVYRARDTRLGRDVAVKVLLGDLAGDPERLRRFEQEARAAAALSHPNIVAIHDVGSGEGIVHVVFELLQGQTLRQALGGRRLPVRRVLDYGVQMCRGLAAAHGRGIIHRDLKPENVFLTVDGQIKLLDFGIARLGEPVASEGADEVTATQPGVIMGTVGYMSPEQARGQRADARSDIFSLGAILYEMLSGRRAFEGETPADTLSAVLARDPPALTSTAEPIGPGLELVVRHCLEKKPAERFQTAADVGFGLQSLGDIGPGPSGAGAWLPRRTAASRWYLLAALAVVAAVGSSALVVRVVSSPPLLKVKGYSQITSDKAPKSGPVTDGARVYFTEDKAGSGPTARVPAQVAAAGGDVARIPVPFGEARIVDLSPDGSSLLVLGQREPLGTATAPVEMWMVPVIGGAARRVGDLRANQAAWSPDATRIAFTYTSGSELYIARADGSASRRVWTAAGLAWALAWSPDGHRLRVTVRNPQNGNDALWEVREDGRDPHPVLADFGPSACCGRWASDGRLFVFQAFSGRAIDIWALPEGTGFWPRSPGKPVRLTQGPLSFSDPAPSRDGRKVFAVGWKGQGELVRYDPRSAQFTPYLSGMSAHFVEFSRDGQWIAYVAFPEGTLWRSRPDGSDRLQLTVPPLVAMNPRFSPDGKEIAFGTMGDIKSVAFGTMGGDTKSLKVNLISTDGGTSRPALPGGERAEADASWSPTGETLAVGFFPWEHRDDRPITIRLLERKTGRVSTVPGSEGLYSQRWSPDGRYLAALSHDSLRLLVYAFASNQWREVLASKEGLSYPDWSRDGRRLFVSEGQARLRLEIPDGRREVVARFEGMLLPFGWVGEAQDDSVLALRDTSIQEIFALEIETP